MNDTNVQNNETTFCRSNSNHSSGPKDITELEGKQNKKPSCNYLENTKKRSQESDTPNYIISFVRLYIVVLIRLITIIKYKKMRGNICKSATGSHKSSSVDTKASELAKCREATFFFICSKIYNAFVASILPEELFVWFSEAWEWIKKNKLWLKFVPVKFLKRVKLLSGFRMDSRTAAG